MVEHCHFTEQQTINGEDGHPARRHRPITGRKHIVIDAKVPLMVHFRARGFDEDARQKLNDHTPGAHSVSQLARKATHAVSEPTSSWFLPGDVFLGCAEQDPTLIEFGADRQLIPASLTTLIAAKRGRLRGCSSRRWRRMRVDHTSKELFEAVHAGRAVPTPWTAEVEPRSHNDAIVEGNVLVGVQELTPTARTSGRSSRSTACLACWYVMSSPTVWLPV
jgi:hypothetical protein